eukprot:4683623-Pyramimonas_sp.AAC.1
MDIGMHTAPGLRYGPLNQDWSGTSSVGTGKSKFWISVVMDGHGYLGERCAEDCGKALVKRLEESLEGCQDTANLEDILKDAFSVAHKAGLKIYNDVPKEYWYPAGAPWAELMKKAHHPTDPVFKNW